MLLDISGLYQPTTTSKGVARKNPIKLSDNIEKNFGKNLGLDNELRIFDRSVISQIAKKQFIILQRYFHPDMGIVANGRMSGIIKESYEHFLQLINDSEFIADNFKKQVKSTSDKVIQEYTVYQKQLIRLKSALLQFLTAIDSPCEVNARFSRNVVFDTLEYNLMFEELLKGYNNTGVKVYNSNNDGGYVKYTNKSTRYIIDSNGNLRMQEPTFYGNMISGFKDIIGHEKNLIGFLSVNEISKLLNSERTNIFYLTENDVKALISYVKTRIYKGDRNRYLMLFRCVDPQGKVYYRITSTLMRVEYDGSVFIKSHSEYSDEVRKQQNFVCNKRTNQRRFGNPFDVLGVGEFSAKMPLEIFKKFLIARYEVITKHYEDRILKLRATLKGEKKNIALEERISQLECKLADVRESFKKIDPRDPSNESTLLNYRAHLMLKNSVIIDEYNKNINTLLKDIERNIRHFLQFLLPTDDKDHVRNLSNMQMQIQPIMSLGRFVTVQLSDFHALKIDSQGKIVEQVSADTKHLIPKKYIVGCIKRDLVEKSGGIKQLIDSLCIEPEDYNVQLIEGNYEARMKNNDVYGKRVPVRYSSTLIDNLSAKVSDGDYLVTYISDPYGGYFNIEGVVVNKKK